MKTILKLGQKFEKKSDVFKMFGIAVPESGRGGRLECNNFYLVYETANGIVSDHDVALDFRSSDSVYANMIDHGNGVIVATDHSKSEDKTNHQGWLTDANVRVVFNRLDDRTYEFIGVWSLTAGSSCNDLIKIADDFTVADGITKVYSK